MNKQHFSRKIGNIYGRSVFAGYVFIFFGLAVFIFSALLEVYRGYFYIGGTIGLVFTLLGLWLSFSYYGVEIRLDKKKIRNFKAYMGIKVGGWHNLPAYESVIVEKVNPDNPSSFKGITPAIRWYKIRYIVVLASGARAQIFSVKPNTKAAYADAEALAGALNLDMIDYLKTKA